MWRIEIIQHNNTDDESSCEHYIWNGIESKKEAIELAMKELRKHLETMTNYTMNILNYKKCIIVFVNEGG